ncbi:MAG: HAD-IC family P-type ATPase, partial [Pseudobdellovibrionaceae bacterium]
VSFICTDKTGTITRGVLELSEFDLPSQVTPKHLFPMIQSAIDPISPDPVDVALLSKLGPSNHSTWSRVKVFPFTEDRKKETVILALSPSEQVAFFKGSPESILKMTELSEDQKSTWLIKVQHWAQQGSKVLGCARRKLTPQEADSTLEPCLDFEFCGLLVFKDTVRAEAKEALAYCRSNGIRVLMLTGDHLDTALAVAREVGLGAKAPQGISASEHPEMFSEDKLALKKNDFKNLDVIARCTPVEKLRIVNALKLSGETVAVTGDGVNDVPALKAAHIGIAMGERGSTSAKEVASIILMDDNFSTIVGAIKEGRQLFKNLQRSFIYLLLIHVPFVLTAAILPLMGYPLIYLPLHIVWLELIIHPTALFGFQQIADPSAASARHAKNFFYGQDLVRILFPSLLVTGLISLIFSQSIQSGALVPEARSKALILLLFWSAGNLALLTNLKTLSAKLVFGITVFSTVLIVQWTFLASFLKLEPLKMNDWLSLSTWTGLALFISWIFQRWGNRHANKA